MKYLKILLVITVSTIFFAACSQSTTSNNATVTNAKPATNSNINSTAETKPSAQADELAAAKKNYSLNCAICHKEDGTGGKITIEGKTMNADNLTTDKMKKMEDAKYIDYIKNGIPEEGMPAFKDKLSEQEIKDVVKFVRKEFQKM